MCCARVRAEVVERSELRTALVARVDAVLWSSCLFLPRSRVVGIGHVMGGTLDDATPLTRPCAHECAPIFEIGTELTQL
eukprot:15229518-Alexandrium_andersonii.AAC.1